MLTLKRLFASFRRVARCFFRNLRCALRAFALQNNTRTRSQPAPPQVPATQKFSPVTDATGAFSPPAADASRFPVPLPAAPTLPAGRRRARPPGRRLLRAWRPRVPSGAIPYPPAPRPAAPHRRCVPIPPSAPPAGPASRLSTLPAPRRHRTRGHRPDYAPA